MVEENKLRQYAEIKAELDSIDKAYKEDTQAITDKINELNQAKKSLYESKYKDAIDKANETLDDLKVDIVGHWGPDKSQRVEDVGLFTMKSTDKVDVFNKVELIKDLTKRDMLANAIKSFDDKFIKNLIGAGVMLPGANIKQSKVLSFTPIKK